MNSEINLKSVKGIVKEYFSHFSSKNLNRLGEMFSEGVILRDWDIFAQGKEAVLAANSNIFESVESISVCLKEFYQDKKTAICLIEIEIDKQDLIKVVDVIKFNEDLKIIEVSAYKQ